MAHDILFLAINNINGENVFEEVSPHEWTEIRFVAEQIYFVRFQNKWKCTSNGIRV